MPLVLPPADGGAEEGPAAKRAKGPGGAGAAGGKKDKEGELHDILDADAFIDMEQETDQLMAGGCALCTLCTQPAMGECLPSC